MCTVWAQLSNFIAFLFCRWKAVSHIWHHSKTETLSPHGSQPFPLYTTLLTTSASILLKQMRVRLWLPHPQRLLITFLHPLHHNWVKQSHWGWSNYGVCHVFTRFAWTSGKTEVTILGIHRARSVKAIIKHGFDSSGPQGHHGWNLGNI